ncbi:MAG TPA: polyprenyl synthetase family protein [Polyangia bacterium]|jgi:geranylgeranyl diphosphate synthase type II|nr:polyprenyl synthetase family protein [Polyangia bacterium]
MPTFASALVKETLEEYGAVARAGLEHYLKRGEPRRHLYDLVADYPRRGGRSLRASACIAAARAFGGATAEAADSAVALEILHNAFLVHDDVEDESEIRRGKPTLHELHGVPVAVNVGDALAVLSIGPLISNFKKLGPGRALRVLEEAERMARESVEGQAVELGWRRDNAVDLRVEDYLMMILKKTCWYTTIYPCRVGAMIGGADEIDIDRVTRFGFFLGAAFQIQDDLLNLVGDQKKYGKELGGDIFEGKRTIMLIRLLQVAPRAERARVVAILSRDRRRRSATDVAWVRGRMEAHRCIPFARELAHGLAGAARHEASLAFAHLPRSRDRRFLEALPLWVLERT